MKYAESILNHARAARVMAARDTQGGTPIAPPHAAPVPAKPFALAPSSPASPPVRDDHPAGAPSARAEGPAAPRVEEGGSRLIVGPNIKLKGVEIDDCDTLVVEGRVEATMVSRVIQVAENGAFNGKVDVEVAEIRGTFQGEMTARRKLVIHSGGRVTGKIRYGRMLVQEGGEVSGDIAALGAELQVAK